MPKTRGGSASAPQSSHKAAPVRASLDVPPHLPDSAPQRRYHTRRAVATPVALTQIPARSPPTKKAKTSEPGESSRAARDSQSQPPSTRRPILTSSPIEGNFDCRARAFHVEAYFDHYVLRQQPELGDSYRLLEREVPPQPLPSIFAPSTSASSEPVPEAASSDAPPTVPPIPEPPITIPGAEYRDLVASFQTLTTTQTTIMERMDHLRLRQDQQTLILREIQQHLGLLPPAPPVSPMPSEPFAPTDDFDPADDATPVAVPSTVAAEDPSYPPEEPTT
ncbi:uncharacterized protein LOC117920514 [Vitis riparia]|uniref:uncharacterized protein LOC117920514 n=1 Tax=Vitis riparia TaxID=96939 RepID=UPI00155AE502|nr:uncharacterized protein LOC117920514 [Vitis riparia]